MKRRLFALCRTLSLVCGVLLVPRLSFGEPTAAATAAFNAYSRKVELRLAQQHRPANGFLASASPDRAAEDLRLRRGEVLLEELTPAAGKDFPGALLHHWRGTAFAPGATAADFERLIRDFSGYPQHFSPEVLQARSSGGGDRVQAWMRIRQRHVITVVMDANYDVTFGRMDARHGYSISESTRIAEIDGAGTRTERALKSDEEHGFLWRLNTYWSYEERDGGLYLQIEAVSLTRSIPRGLGWVIRPYIESIPRESLEFTLLSACGAIRK